MTQRTLLPTDGGNLDGQLSIYFKPLYPFQRFISVPEVTLSSVETNNRWELNSYAFQAGFKFTEIQGIDLKLLLWWTFSIEKTKEEPFHPCFKRQKSYFSPFVHPKQLRLNKFLQGAPIEEAFSNLQLLTLLWPNFGRGRFVLFYWEPTCFFNKSRDSWVKIEGRLKKKTSYSHMNSQDGNIRLHNHEKYIYRATLTHRL